MKKQLKLITCILLFGAALHAQQKKELPPPPGNGDTIGIIIKYFPNDSARCWEVEHGYMVAKPVFTNKAKGQTGVLPLGYLWANKTKIMPPVTIYRVEQEK